MSRRGCRRSRRRWCPLHAARRRARHGRRLGGRRRGRGLRGGSRRGRRRSGRGRRRRRRRERRDRQHRASQAARRRRHPEEDEDQDQRPSAPARLRRHPDLLLLQDPARPGRTLARTRTARRAGRRSAGRPRRAGMAAEERLWVLVGHRREVGLRVLLVARRGRWRELPATPQAQREAAPHRRPQVVLFPTVRAARAPHGHLSSRGTTPTAPTRGRRSRARRRLGSW
jgi:hypothetical protein